MEGRISRRVLREHVSIRHRSVLWAAGPGTCCSNYGGCNPQAELFGLDIAPTAARFWRQPESAGIHLRVGDFRALNRRTYDVVLILDLLEHIAIPMRS